jgi:signal transduction histidine kinase
VRLLRQVPAITELIQLDATGKEQLRVSRLAMDVVGSGKDYSHEQSFTEAKKHRVWFSPVYFRKESEPYLTLSMAQAGHDGGVTIAEVNLKLIWDVISGMKIGEGGYAYVIDRNGRLIAHPDISLVLRDTDLRGLPQVAAAEAEAQNDQIAPPAMVARNLGGERVLTAHAVITPLGWTVFVELPLREAMAPLYATAWRNAAILAVAIGLATLAAMFLARRMVGPIRLLQAGAARIGAGELDRRLDIHTGDELEELAGEFNRMAGDLQKSYAELEQKVEDRTAELKEALDQQTATAEVLGVINSSPGDLAPVFEAVLDKATSLCDAAFGILWTYDGERFYPVALHRTPPPFADFLRSHQATGFSATPGTAGLGAMLDGEAFQQTGDPAAGELYRSRRSPLNIAFVELGGARSGLIVPLRKESKLLGAIRLFRQEVRPFSEKQIALLQNFAAQAVIAMENARLITETREALEQQTATAEVLGVINSSPGDLAPVFDKVLEKAVSLCEAAFGSMLLYNGKRFDTVAVRGVPAAFADYVKTDRPVHGPGTGPARILAGERVVHILDLAAEEPYRARDPQRRALVDLGGARSLVCVPLLMSDAVLGIIVVYRQEVRPFSEKQIALLQNFAAQAVIAMENARLLNELRDRTRDLQESLEYQTSTSDVLKVISRSAFDLDTVLQTVVTTAVRLCRADSATIYRNIDGEYQWAAGHMLLPDYEQIERNVRIRPSTGTLVGRTATERRTVHILDAWTDPLYEVKDDARVGGVHSMIGVPLLREGEPVGVIGLARRRVEAFSEREAQLVTTFADQAVIAIENARLFNELRARTAELGSSVAELKMLNEVAQAVSSTLDLRTVLSTVLNASLGVTWANAGAVFRYSRAERAFRLVEAVGWDETLTRSVRELRIAETESAMGEAAARRTPIQLADLAQRPTPLRELTLAAGFHSALIVPLAGAERILGAIILMRHEAGEFPPETVRLMQTIASQSVLAIQNARLFREIADKSEQLALASQHKSQFLANMSHELRTPLNAILGYAELLVDGIYGALPDRPKGVLERIQNNGKHLLALINDVLDLAKIEAGQLTLTLEDYSLPEVVKSVVSATEPLATSKGLKFTAAVQDGLPTGHGDARRLSQVLLNLVGNAIKFTDAGEVEIRAALERGQFVLTVRDTGPGIAEADQDRIFGEFQQIDNSSTRQRGGTGLGLAISKRMVEMQGGTISVDSVLGHGSTFRVVLPVHVDEIMEEAA